MKNQAIAVKPHTPFQEGTIGLQPKEGEDLVQVYRCSNPKCKETDRIRLFPNEIPPVAINCICGAGRGIALTEMIRRGAGMFPILEGSKTLAIGATN